MRNLYRHTKELDKRANNFLNIPSILLMENAARGMLEFLKLHFLKQDSPLKILCVCGSGDNGADCLALARMLYEMCSLEIYLPLGMKSTLCQMQFDMLQKVAQAEDFKNISFLEDLDPTKHYDIIVDGIFGIGFRGTLSDDISKILKTLNAFDCIKIACDIPSGITQDGVTTLAFKADYTLTMGAHKIALYSDLTKDYVGKVHLIDLGVSEKVFAPTSAIKLLEVKDFKAPTRTKQNTNKGDFGHLCVFSGEKQGAAILSALAGLRSGAGLTSVYSQKEIPHLPFELMQCNVIPHNTTAILLGMGLGQTYPLPQPLLSSLQIPLLLDADIFYHKELPTLLQNHKNLIMTPHPKEFTQILTSLNLATISTQDLQQNRIHYALEFCKHYPNVVLVLKGANTLIAKEKEVFVHSFGNNALSKGGSGDVLAGIIGGYLAQGNTTLDSAIQGVLLHSFCAESYVQSHNNFSLSPLDLIEELKNSFS